MRPIDYAALTERTCNRCGETKPVSEFSRYADSSAPLTGWRYYSHCRDCNKQQCKAYGAANRPRRNARLKSWRANNKPFAKALDRRRSLSRKYGLTEADFNRMFAEQGGRCLVCDQKKRLVVDHCHATGLVRGLLCHKCNLAIGVLETIMQDGFVDKAMAYIKQDLD
jgi:hypothetical protein